MHLHDCEGVEREVILKDALLVPSYNQDVFSVQAATSKGCIVCYETKNAQFKTLIIKLLPTLLSVKGCIIYLLGPPWAGRRKKIIPPFPCMSYEATKRWHLRSIDALVTSKSFYPRCLP